MAMAPLNQQRSATDALCGDFRTWCDSCAVHKHLRSWYTYHWSHLILMQIDDASDFANEVLISHPSIPHFVGGQSLGGLISTLVALQDQSKWTGMILCSAAMNVEWTLALRQDMFTSSLPVLPAYLDVAAADNSRLFILLQLSRSHCSKIHCLCRHAGSDMHRSAKQSLQCPACYRCNVRHRLRDV